LAGDAGDEGYFVFVVVHIRNLKLTGYDILSVWHQTELGSILA
jgi:hypothetical protein